MERSPNNRQLPDGGVEDRIILNMNVDEFDMISSGLRMLSAEYGNELRDLDPGADSRPRVEARSKQLDSVLGDIDITINS